MKIEGFLLDLDGVIAETSELHFLAWSNLAASLGIALDKAFNEQLKGIGRMESLERILTFANRSEQYSQEEKTRLTEEKNIQYVKLLERMAPEDTLPGIRTFLTDARADGVKLAVASASKNAPTILRALELLDSVDFIADAGRARSKPCPDIFLAAATGIGLTPSVCVGIEDAAAGIQAIHAAGMKAVGIGSVKYLNEAELVLHSTYMLKYEYVRGFFLEADRILPA